MQFQISPRQSSLGEREFVSPHLFVCIYLNSAQIETFEDGTVLTRPIQCSLPSLVFRRVELPLKWSENLLVGRPTIEDV
jgi:hypothetical protein